MTPWPVFWNETARVLTITALSVGVVTGVFSLIVYLLTKAGDRSDKKFDEKWYRDHK